MRRGPRRDRSRSNPDSSASALTSPSGRLKASFVALVGLSGGMMALQGGASLAVVGLAVGGGIAAGAALLWYLLWILE